MLLLLLLFAAGEGEGELLTGATLATGVGVPAGVLGKTVVVVPGAGRVTPLAGVGGTWTVLAVQRTCHRELVKYCSAKRNIKKRVWSKFAHGEYKVVTPIALNWH